MDKIKVAIADDHKLFRQGLALTLKYADEIELIWEASNGQELIDTLVNSQPHVILTDINMPIMDGITSTQIISKKYSQIKILALSMHDDEYHILKMLHAGAKGYLLKSAEPEEIINAIITVYKSNYYFNEQTSVLMLKGLMADIGNNIGEPDIEKIELSEREKQVLELICMEFTNNQIGEKLCVSMRTIEGYRNKIYEKTKTKSTVGLVIYAIKNEIIEI